MDDGKERARDAALLDVVADISGALDTGLDREALSIVMKLCDLGVNPEALAEVVRKLRTMQEDARSNQDSKNNNNSRLL